MESFQCNYGDIYRRVRRNWNVETGKHKYVACNRLDLEKGLLE